MANPEDLLARIRALPPERVAEVEDFVAFVTAREQDRVAIRTAAAMSAPSFATVWDNPDDAEYDAL